MKRKVETKKKKAAAEGDNKSILLKSLPLDHQSLM